MTYEAASRIDAGDEARTQVSMIKVFATEMAWDVIDHAMQIFGAMGMTEEPPLQQMVNETRLMRIDEGPSEVHRRVIARDRSACAARPSFIPWTGGNTPGFSLSGDNHATVFPFPPPLPRAGRGRAGGNRRGHAAGGVRR